MFRELFDNYSWEEVSNSIYAKTSTDVERALAKSKIDLDDFKALISPAAEAYLEPMAQLSHKKTTERFGKTMQMYAPLYLSNECQNICTYCGFSLNIDIPRKTLSDEEILAEIKVIKSMGFDHVLVVTGEANKTVGLDYFKNAFEIINQHFSYISLEVQPMDQTDYKALIPKGLNAVLIYQETYHKNEYKKHHPKGKKSNFYYRLDTPDRLGKAKIQKIGLGALYGLEDWRVDTFFTALHLNYLERTYWETKYAISFPRLRPCAGGVELKSEMTDKQLAQVICAYRILNQEVELSLSTRESQAFRNNAFKLGITSISAGSKTDPGGYANPKENLEQFEISDDRTPAEYEKVLQNAGYDVMWKDWDRSLM